MTRATLAVALASVAALWPAAGGAYVRSRTGHGTATHWAAGCVFVQPDSAGSPDLDPTMTFTTVQASMQAWRDATASCNYLAFNYQPPAALDAHFDGTNVIKFRTDKWCHPDDDQSKGVCYSSVAAGITTVFYVDRQGDPEDGNILDADIELNNIDFTFDFVDRVAGPTKQPRSGTTIADFENTLVHELGHLQGLDHTCRDAATPSTEVDETGQPPPDCTSLKGLPLAEYQKITEATMFNSAVPAETKKRSPEADDVAGICNIYPIATPTRQCVAADISSYKKSGCAMGGRSPWLGPAALLCLLALALRRRRA